MKFSLFTFEFTPEELKSLDLEKYARQALIDGIKEPKDEPEIISKDNSTKSDTKDLLPDNTPDKIGSEMGERIANKIKEYSKNIVSEPDTSFKPCFIDLLDVVSDSKQSSSNNEIPDDMKDYMNDVYKQIKEQLVNRKIGDASDEDDKDDEQE